MNAVIDPTKETEDVNEKNMNGAGGLVPYVTDANAVCNYEGVHGISVELSGLQFIAAVAVAFHTTNYLIFPIQFLTEPGGRLITNGKIAHALIRSFIWAKIFKNKC